MNPIAKVLWITLLLNVLVAAAKIAAGVLSGSLTLMSDGIHSVSDAAGNVIGLVGIHWATKPADDDHHYGHQKIEVLAALAVALFLFVTAWELGGRAIEALSDPPEARVGALAFTVVGVTFGVNLFVAVYESRAAKRLKSRLLEADAAHTTSDLYVTASVLVSLFALQAGWPFVDAIFAGGIALYIAWIGWTIVAKNVEALTDAAPLDPGRVQEIVLGVDGVHGCDGIRARGWEGHIFIDLQIQVDPALTTVEGHHIAHAVMDRLREHIDGVEDVVIHTEPLHE